MKKIFLSLIVFGVAAGSSFAQIGQSNPLGSQNEALNVSVSLDGSFTPKAIIEWLRKQKISFIISSNANFGDIPIEVHIKDQSLRDTLEALAFAIGGQWLEKGDIYILNGPQVIVSNGVIVTTGGRVISNTPPKALMLQPTNDGQRTQSANMKIFAYSLTSAQKNLMKKRGYLTLKDLSKQQLTYLANPKSDGSHLKTVVEGLVLSVKMSR